MSTPFQSAMHDFVQASYAYADEVHGIGVRNPHAERALAQAGDVLESALRQMMRSAVSLSRQRGAEMNPIEASAQGKEAGLSSKDWEWDDECMWLRHAETLDCICYSYTHGDWLILSGTGWSKERYATPADALAAFEEALR